MDFVRLHEEIHWLKHTWQRFSNPNVETTVNCLALSFQRHISSRLTRYKLVVNIMQRSGCHHYHLKKKWGLIPAKTPDISTPPKLGVQPNPPPPPGTIKAPANVPDSTVFVVELCTCGSAWIKRCVKKNMWFC